MPLDALVTQTPAPATIPGNTRIAVDQIPGTLEYVQYVKLMDGTENQQGVIPGGSGGLAVDVRTSIPLPVTGTFWPVTQPISGSVSITGTPGQVDTELTLVNFADPVTAANMGSSAPPVQSILVGFDGTNYGRARVGPMGTALTGTPPVLYVQGIGVGGAVPISGSITTTAGPGDDTGFTFGTGAPTPVTPSGFVFDEVSLHTLVTEDRVAAARVNLNRAQVITVEDATQAGASAKAKVEGSALRVVSGTMGALGDVAPGSTATLGLGAGAYLIGVDSTSGNYVRVRNSAAGTAIAATTLGVLGVQGVGSGYPLAVSLPNPFTPADGQTAGNLGTTVAPVQSVMLGYNGATYDRLRVSTVGTSIPAGVGALGVQGITNGIAVKVDGTGGTFPISGSLTANQTVDLARVGGTATVTGGVNGSQGVGGLAAHNAAVVGNPVNQGAQVAPTTQIDNAAATQALLTQLIADPVGKLITLPYAAPAMMVSGATAAMIGVASTLVLPIPTTAAHRNYITQITVTNSHATVGTDILIQDGNAGTTLYVIPAAAVYGGATITFPVPLRQPTAATAIYAQNVVTGASTRVSISGYVGR